VAVLDARRLQNSNADRLSGEPVVPMIKKVETHAMRFMGGFKYRLEEEFIIKTRIRVSRIADDKNFLRLEYNGWLIIRKGYSWDGPSGPTFDSDDFMIGSLVHDALYQLIREKLIERNWKRQADLELYDLCRRSGMPYLRAQYVYWGVRWFADSSAVPGKTREIRVVTLGARK